MRVSPLFGTAMVMVVLGLLAIPLRELTSAGRAAEAATRAAAPTADASASASVSGVIRFRLLRAAESLELQSDHGELLWKSGPASAGETETELALPMQEGECVLRLRASFPDDGGETAVFVTVLPDGIEERSAYAIGSGEIEERLVFSWPADSHREP